VTSFLDKLPTILTLAVLVGIFLALRKHSPAQRVRLWTFAWVLVFVHFLIKVFETHAGFTENLVESVDLGALELSGVVFVVSMMQAIVDRWRRVLLLACLVVPTAFHAVVATSDWRLRGLEMLALAILTAAGAIFVAREIGWKSPLGISLAALVVGAGVWALLDQWHGNPEIGIVAILSLTFGISGVLFWRLVRRWSPGVVAVAGGFLAWGAVFPAAVLVAHFRPGLQVNPELWNVPKFFVAIGMVLTILEDQSRLVDESRAQERAENLLLHQLSLVTSRLLDGREVASLGKEIAEAITDTSSFRSAALFLLGDDRSLTLAGSSGVRAAELDVLRSQLERQQIEGIKQICASGEPLGNNAYLLCDAPGQAVARKRQIRQIMIPLVSRRGAYVGGLWLSKQGEAESHESAELGELAMLAADLAVTLENQRLHRQLVRSEKLAALGQLVAGVAHELNNPLTGILGYGELLAEEVEKESARNRLEKLAVEARRMKRIVDGLLRFGRQGNPDSRSADVSIALHDVIQLREYHLRKFGIEVDLKIEGAVGSLAIGDDELKQILLNVLNNAIDAVEDSARRKISIRAFRQDDRVAIRFEDTGPGFHDLGRAFDPFYTTKAVGKGTGLGLSICYGIAHEHGGDIALANKHPYGASVVIELPTAGAPVFRADD